MSGENTHRAADLRGGLIVGLGISVAPEQVDRRAAAG
jgi:hypothetical protein